MVSVSQIPELNTLMVSSHQQTNNFQLKLKTINNTYKVGLISSVNVPLDRGCGTLRNNHVYNWIYIVSEFGKI